MLSARYRSICSVLFLLFSVKTTGDILSYKKFTRDLENILGNGDPIIAVAVIDETPTLRTYVPENNPRMFPKLINQDLRMDLVQEKDVTKTKNAELQMAPQNSAVIGMDDENDEFEGIQLTKKQKAMLRQKWRSSCDKKAAKTCKKACDRARKRACKEYHCKRSISKNIKKQCKLSCNFYFIGGKSDSLDISDFN